MDEEQIALASKLKHCRIQDTHRSNTKPKPDIVRSKCRSASSSRTNSFDNDVCVPVDYYQSMALDFLTSGSIPHNKPHHFLKHHSQRSASQREIRHHRPVDHVLAETVTETRSAQDLSKHHSGSTEVARIRGFTTTPNGLVSDGEFILKRSSSIGTDNQSLPGSPSSTCSGPKVREIYKVCLLGSTGVGKHALIDTFVSNDAEYSTYENYTTRAVSILLDGEESTLEFMDLSDTRLPSHSASLDQVSAYVVVYSVEDRRSYEAAINRLLEIREDAGDNVALILVANKTDLVRTRVVSEEEGYRAANTYSSKYIEVSVALDLKTDELLVGVLKQIRIHKRRPDRHHARHAHSCLLGACFLNRACPRKAHNARSKSSDNLYLS